MIVTSGDLFFALITGGVAAVFAGIAFAIAERHKPLPATALIGGGLATIVAPALGVIGTLMQRL